MAEDFKPKEFYKNYVISHYSAMNDTQTFISLNQEISQDVYVLIRVKDHYMYLINSVFLLLFFLTVFWRK